ncbi:butyrophilin-like protein 2 isoform 2-T2 [Polymixia lowei]
MAHRQCNVIGSSQPIVAQAGEDVILPCHLEPPRDVTDLTVEWRLYRDTVKTVYVHIYRHGQSVLGQERTSLFTDELKKGNISLKISSVTLSDAGKYTCFVSKLNITDKEDFVHLIVESTEIISNTGDKVEVVCSSSGWINVSNSVQWQNSSGMILSVESPEIIQSSDGLYTVSSTVIIKNTNTRSFTCRLQGQRTEGSKGDGSGQPPTSDPDSLSIVGIVIAVFIFIIILAAVLLYKKCRNPRHGNRQEDQEMKGMPQGEEEQRSGGDEPGEEEALRGGDLERRRP